MTTRIAASPVLWVGVVVGVLMIVASLVGGASAGSALLGGAIAVGYAAVVTVVGRRSEVASTLAGRPVDERWEHINLEATTWALGITAVVVLAGCLVEIASNGPWEPYAFIAVVIAVAYLGSLLIIRRQH